VIHVIRYVDYGVKA